MILRKFVSLANLSRFSFGLTLVFLAFAGMKAQGEEEKFRVGMVDVQRVFQEFYKTRDAEEAITERRILIQKEDRRVRSRMAEINYELREINREGAAEETTEEKREELRRKFEGLEARRNLLDQQRENSHKEAHERLNQEMLQTMQGILGEIHRFVKDFGDGRGFDLILDSSGTTINQTAPVLGGQGMDDLTAIMIAELNRTDPALGQHGEEKKTDD